CFSANVPFADLDLTGAYLSSDAYREIIKNKDDVSNLNISYAENPDSTVILPGRHTANITFTYNSYNYSAHNVIVFGYVRSETTCYDPYITNHSVHVRETNSLDGIFYKYTGVVELFSQETGDDHEKFYFDSGNIQLTEDNCILDENAFTVVGNHTIQLKNAFGSYISNMYHVYDPEVCNIDSLYYNETPTFKLGTTVEEFYEYMADKYANIIYFENDGTLPIKVIIPSECFSITNEILNKAGESAIFVTYQGCRCAITIKVVPDEGTLIKTYTCEDPNGISTVFGDNVTTIEFYDNGCVKTNVDPSTYVSYEIDGTTMIVYLNEIITVKVTVDDNAKTFKAFVNEANILFTVKTNFHGLVEEAPDAYLYTAYIYDNNVISINMSEDTDPVMIDFTYTTDPEDPLVIYFTFAMGPMEYPAKGIINTAQSQLDLYPAN
ncbi:MAG: hypothetical protein K6F59_00700, partial [Gammaproteobacteria bacterium]|nr:hypothetical protein [Gammaproteobacteria bacterium]